MSNGERIVEIDCQCDEPGECCDACVIRGSKYGSRGIDLYQCGNRILAIDNKGNRVVYSGFKDGIVARPVKPLEFSDLAFIQKVEAYLLKKEAALMNIVINGSDSTAHFLPDQGAIQLCFKTSPIAILYKEEAESMVEFITKWKPRLKRAR